MKNFSSRGLALFLFALAQLVQLALHVPAANGGHLYFSDRGASVIYRSDFHGNNVEELFSGAKITGSNLFRGVTADPTRGFVFFCDSIAGKVFRGDLQTKSVEQIVDDQSFPADITIDRENGEIYWCERNANLIHRANFDGTDIEDLVSVSIPYFLQLDLESGKIYFGDFGSQGKGNIFRANIADGSDVEKLVSDVTGQVRGVHLDQAAGMLYWANRNEGKIQRRPLDGQASDIEDIYAGLDTPHGMTLDIPARKVYWADTGTNGDGGQLIQRGDMDGSGEVETLFKGNQPWDVFIDPSLGTYSDWSTRYFRKGAPPEVIAQDADPDLDSSANKLELAFGSHPLDAGSQPILSPSLVEVNDRAFPALTFERSAGGAPFLTYTVERSTDLRTWKSGRAVAFEPVPGTPERETVTILSLSPIENRSPAFLRLRID